MKTFLVESYLPRDRAAELEATLERLRGLRGRGRRVGTAYLGSFYASDDEVCYHLFLGSSVEAVRSAAEPLIAIDHIGEAEPRLDVDRP